MSEIMATSQSEGVWNRLGQLGLAAQAALVCACSLLLWLAAAPLADWLSGADGLWAAAAAAAATLVGGLVALVLASLFRGPTAAMQGMLVGMLARMVLPMAIGVALHLKVRALADAGMIFYLLVFYMATLALETALALARIRLPFTPTKAL